MSSPPPSPSLPDTPSPPSPPSPLSPSLTTTSPPSPLLSLASSLATIAVATFGGGLAGYSLLRSKTKTKGKAKALGKTAFGHLPSQWAVRCGAFAAVYEGGKVCGAVGREALTDSYQTTLQGNQLEDFRLFRASALGRGGGVLVDTGFAGGMAGVLGSSVGVNAMFMEGGKVLRMSSKNVLSNG